MQQLAFHPAWDKTISDNDRLLIEELYEQTYDQVDDFIMSPVIRAAINYKKELLVTVLVHNFTHHAARFKERSIFIQCDKFEAEQVFTIPDLIIAPFTSMPWTFIFQANPVYEQLELTNLVLEID